ncbi:MAG: MogA/MoaB family molybdenum cofactor biosynthesis protein [Thermodesulfobacteriota bacterium]|nr:MogA/MoaB family molybdenum cofactor biosynthesis protein [Thermodesulfobacteriota bacterium]
MIRAGVLTLSDKASKGQREDISGKIVQAILRDADITTVLYEIIPDEYDLITSKLIDWCDNKSISLIVTTGGTGLSPRDFTPDATLNVIEKEVPGMEEVMRIKSLEKTPHAMISRAAVGIRKETLIVNLPGSPGAVQDCLNAIMGAIPHALKKIGGDMSDCT